ncbi:hypothetical protein HDU87_005474 [Geranomyces variabilis]|uniref:3'-5' exonuclease domain-containing protein n=1 Tax=Geranomyces variabilis TaxID=109894 RepID=A0AAD5TGR3_9FUNG|nr:hypothetical protein HDU87_005474 [Geranomyces variabilis]
MDVQRCPHTSASTPVARKTARKLPWQQSPAVTSAGPPALTPALPLLNYNQAPGENYNVTYVTTPADVARGLKLCSGNVLGFDMEWCVPFRRGIQPTTALIQICNDRHIVRRNIKGDALKLHRDFGILMEGSLDIANIARRVRPECRKNPSLKLLVEQVLHATLAKGPVRVGNWEARGLSREQMFYAGNDVYAGYRIYETLLQEAAQQGHHTVVHDYFSMADYLAEREAVKIAKVKRGASDTFFEDDPLPESVPEVVAAPGNSSHQAKREHCENARQQPPTAADRRNQSGEEQVPSGGTQTSRQAEWGYSSDNDTEWALLMDGVEGYVAQGQFGVLGDKASDDQLGNTNSGARPGPRSA